MPILVGNQYTLGNLIDALERREHGQDVVFDFGGLAPDGVDSYRGFYEDLAIGFSPERSVTVTVAEFLEVLRGALGKTFSGYKGGNYTMGRDTALWVARRGEAPGTIITNVGGDNEWGKTVLFTTWISV